MTRSSRSSRLRRYPALAYLIGAGALAVLLPSGLTLPRSGPPTLAEFAPVPGQSEGADAPASELGAASSGGLGTGGGSGANGAGRTTSTVPAGGGGSTGGRLVRKAGTKRCVGDPPRQTEDPLSPPCIAFFDGDNFGATGKGVTRDEVLVMAQFNYRGDDPDEGKVIDCRDAPGDNDQIQELLCKAYQKYFNDRYQTYERNVHLYSIHNVAFPNLDERFHPFASISFQGASSDGPKRGSMAFGYVGGFRTTYQKYAGLLGAFQPDIEDTNAIAASFVCEKLVGRPARYAGDPLLRARERKFAYWADDTQVGATDRALLEELKAQCNLQPTIIAGSVTTDQTASTRLHQDNVTTIITNINQTNSVLVTQQATRSGYFPEWFIPGGSGLRDLNNSYYGRQMDAAQWANAFGVLADYRRGAVDEQPWYRAYREGCPSCREPRTGEPGVDVAPQAYDVLALLFYGIQSAGPKLTAANVDKGLHAIPPRASQDPFQPAAYFGPANYSYVKDSTAVWWDASGVPPGSPVAGCYRLVNGGKRFRAREWAATDDDIKAAGPCQGDTVPAGG